MTLFNKAYQSISCVDSFWFCPSNKAGCTSSFFNKTLTVKQACPYTCGVCRSNFPIFISFLNNLNIDFIPHAVTAKFFHFK